MLPSLIVKSKKGQSRAAFGGLTEVFGVVSFLADKICTQRSAAVLSA